MLKKLLFLALAMTCLCSRAYADSDGYATMVVEFKDGTEIVYVLNDETSIYFNEYAQGPKPDGSGWYIGSADVTGWKYTEDEPEEMATYSLTQQEIKRWYFKSTTLGIERVATNNLKLMMDGKQVRIVNLKANNKVHVYTVAGVMVYEGKDSVINLPSTGIYLISIDNRQYKIVAK